MYEIKTKTEFDAAHILHGHRKCGRVHGHRWTVFVHLRSMVLTDGMVVDFTDIKNQLNKIIEYLDHHILIPKKYIDEVKTTETPDGFPQDTYVVTINEGRYEFPADDVTVLDGIDQTTAENLAKWLYDKLSDDFPVSKIEVWETPNNCATYIPGGC